MSKIAEQWSNVQRYPVFDQAEALKVTGTTKVLNELLELLTISILTESANLEQAYKSHNWQEIAKLAHKITGGAIYCGVIKLRFASQNLERYYDSGESPLLEQLYQQLLTTLHETQDVITRHLGRNRV